LRHCRAKTRQSSHLNKDRSLMDGRINLDGMKSVFLASGSIMNAIAAGQVDAKFSLVTPPQQAYLQSARGETASPSLAPLVSGLWTSGKAAESA
jgi:hypothetical protein